MFMSGDCLNRCLRAFYSVSDYTRIISDFLSDIGPGTCCVVVVERQGEGFERRAPRLTLLACLGISMRIGRLRETPSFCSPTARSALTRLNARKTVSSIYLPRYLKSHILRPDER